MKRWMIAAGLWLALGAEGPAWAQGTEGVEQLRATVLNLIRALVDQGVLTAAKAQDMLRQAGLDPALLNAPQVTQTAPTPSEPPKPVVRVPYVPEIVKDELREQVKQEVLAQARAERWGEPGALPEWLNRFSLYGDVKLRFQSDRYASDNDLVQNINPAFGQPQGTIVDSTEARDRVRVRARLGVDANVSETVKAGVRLVTSGPSEDPFNPTSEYFDVGQNGQRYGANFDLAYVRWNVLPSLSLFGGRVENPYLGTDLVWAADSTFDSVVARWRPLLSNSWTGFVTLGGHWILSTSAAPGMQSNNAWLYAAQSGLQAAWPDHSSFTFGAAYYDFKNLEGRLNPALPTGNSLYANFAVPFRKPGNTTFNINFLSDPNGAPVFALASQFRLVDALTRLDWGGLDPMHIAITGEFVRNIGFDASEIANRIGPATQALPQDRTGATGLQRKRVNGYLAELKIGANSILRRGDWNGFTGYRLLQRDAVVAEFTSADYRLGGTDEAASYFGFGYGVANSTSLTVRYITGRSLDLATKYSVDTWLIDLQTRF